MRLIRFPRRCLSARFLANRPNKELEEEDGIYTPSKDPMAGMTEEEKNKIKSEIMQNTQKATSMGYAFVGAALLLMTVNFRACSIEYS
jgi:hypothetical protein